MGFTKLRGIKSVQTPKAAGPINARQDHHVISPWPAVAGAARPGSCLVACLCQRVPAYQVGETWLRPNESQ